MEAALQKQMGELNERNAQLEALLMQARRDFKKLTEEAAMLSCKAESHLETIGKMQAAQYRAEKAEDLHDLLLLRRTMMQMVKATAQHRHMHRINAAASKLGDRTCQRFMFQAFRYGVRLSNAARRLRERVVCRRIDSAAAHAFALVEEASEAADTLLPRDYCDVGDELKTELQQNEAIHAAAMCELRAQVLRCGTYEAVLKAASAEEEMRSSCCIHMLGAFFARLMLHKAQARLSSASAAVAATRSAVQAAAARIRVLATETQQAEMARAHARHCSMASFFMLWKAGTRNKRGNAARRREGVLFQAYLLRFTSDGTRHFMERESRLAIGAGTSSGAGALLWMIAARHSWLHAARRAFAALLGKWSEAKAAMAGYNSGGRELLFRIMYCWSAVAHRSRLVKIKSDEAHRMRARRLLALARGTLIQWREKLAAANKLHLRLHGIRLRRETSNVRKLWYTWCLERGQAMRQEQFGVEDELDSMRDHLAKEEERANASDVACMQLTDKLQLLSADKAKAEVEMVDYRRKVENLSIALDEASVVEKDLRLQLERERLHHEDLVMQQQTLRGEVSEQRSEAVAASASLALEKESMAQQADALRSEALSLRAELGQTLESLKLRDEQVEVCQATLRETLSRLDSTAAKAKEDAERAAMVQAALERRISDKDTELGLLQQRLCHSAPGGSQVTTVAHSLPATAHASSAQLEEFDALEAPTHIPVDLQPEFASKPGPESLLNTAELLQKQYDFAKRKRDIDSQFRSRMVGLASDEENAVPNLLRVSTHSPAGKHGAGNGVGGQTVAIGVLAPSQGVVTEHQQEMRSLHHEIEALQSRILSRLNSNSEFSGQADHGPLP